MKHFGLLFTLVFLLGLATNVHAQGIDFFHGTFAEAQAKAKKENKLIFMDAYTTWCGPCKWMAANTFTDAGVGEYFNQHFINLKVDMEKGEGRELQRRYRVMAFPTLLFIDGAGEVKHRTMGAKPADKFIALGKEASAKKVKRGTN